jgi:hypothetical protein
MRMFFLLLVFANLIFFAWTQGLLGASDDGHEPQRLTQQLHAEKLRILREAQKSAAKKDDMACRIVGGLSLADAEELRVAVEAGGGKAQVLPLAEPMIYLAVIIDLPNKAAADKKSAELTRFGLKEFSDVALEGGRHEIVLGRFETEAAAQSFLQSLAKRGIKSARVDGRPQPAVKARVETRAAASVLLQQLPKLIAPYAGAAIGECVT